MDETQSTCTTTQATSSTRSSRKKLNDLDMRIEELEMQIEKILKEKEEAEAEVNELINENLVIAFVDALEKAHDYFTFKDLLKQSPDIKVIKAAFKGSLKQSPDIKADNTVERINDAIMNSQALKEQSKKIDDKVIQTAIKEFISKMKNKQEIRSRYSYMKWLADCASQSDIAHDMKDVHNAADKFPGLSNDKKECELKNYKTFLAQSPASKEDTITRFRDIIANKRDRALADLYEDYDYYATVNVFYDLVFKPRPRKYVMDENPKKELYKIMEIGSPTYYDLRKQFKKMMLSSHTRVLIRDISCGATDDDVKRVFSSCGEIECVEFKRVKKGNVAFVTYKKPEEAHSACLLQSPQVSGHAVRVVRAFNSSPPSGSAGVEPTLESVKDFIVRFVGAFNSSRRSKYQSYHVEGVEPTLENVKDFISSMRDKTLDKYKDIVSSRRDKISSKRNKINSKRDKTRNKISSKRDKTRDKHKDLKSDDHCGCQGPHLWFLIFVVLFLSFIWSQI